MKDELTSEAYEALSKYRQERAHETLEEIPFLREKGYYGTAPIGCTMPATMPHWLFCQNTTSQQGPTLE